MKAHLPYFVAKTVLLAPVGCGASARIPTQEPLPRVGAAVNLVLHDFIVDANVEDVCSVDAGSAAAEQSLFSSASFRARAPRQLALGAYTPQIPSVA